MGQNAGPLQMKAVPEITLSHVIGHNPVTSVPASQESNSRVLLTCWPSSSGSPPRAGGSPQDWEILCSFLRPYPFWAQTLGTIVCSKDFRGQDTTGRIASGGWVSLDGSEKKPKDGRQQGQVPEDAAAWGFVCAEISTGVPSPWEKDTWHL